MLTDFGKRLRMLRIEKDEKLLDMADRLEISSSFLSAVENGKKSPPSGFEEEVITAYDLDKDIADQLRNLADRARNTFVLKPESDMARNTAGMLARRMDGLSDNQLIDIQKILKRSDRNR